MKLSLVCTSTMSGFVVTVLTVAAFSSQARALNFSGISSGTWEKPTPGSINDVPVFTGVGSNTFTWGDAKPSNPRFATPPNQLVFTGNSFSTQADSLFKIGNLSYFNGTVPEGTSVESVPLNLRISFSNPSNLSEAFNFDFDLKNTPNTSKNPADNADFVAVKENFGSRSFAYEGIKYTLALTSFSQDEGKTRVNEFRVLEGEKTTSAIYAKITQVSEAKKVPEPGAIAGLSLLGLYLISRKKNTRD
jgi:hypothetical protein